mmetsp:Transcript_12373/g.28221  ORF Transcript_12373/g.28221 Transcript_12373/m.28221 type:complete len:87 (+) Transcript_12373:99-359(+)
MSESMKISKKQPSRRAISGKPPLLSLPRRTLPNTAVAAVVCPWTVWYCAQVHRYGIGKPFAKVGKLDLVQRGGATTVMMGVKPKGR